MQKEKEYESGSIDIHDLDIDYVDVNEVKRETKPPFYVVSLGRWVRVTYYFNTKEEILSLINRLKEQYDQLP
jgi:hypothetical protein